MENMYFENQKFSNQSVCKWNISKLFIYKTQGSSVRKVLAIEMKEPDYEPPELT